jgi:hypothetical protein
VGRGGGGDIPFAEDLAIKSTIQTDQTMSGFKGTTSEVKTFLKLYLYSVHFMIYVFQILWKVKSYRYSVQEGTLFMASYEAGWDLGLHA